MFTCFIIKAYSDRRQRLLGHVNQVARMIFFEQRSFKAGRLQVVTNLYQTKWEMILKLCCFFSVLHSSECFKTFVTSIHSDTFIDGFKCSIIKLGIRILFTHIHTMMVRHSKWFGVEILAQRQVNTLVPWVSNRTTYPLKKNKRHFCEMLS